MPDNIQRLIEAVEELTEELKRGCDCGSHECGDLISAYGQNAAVDHEVLVETVDRHLGLGVPKDPHCRDDLECYDES